MVDDGAQVCPIGLPCAPKNTPEDRRHARLSAEAPGRVYAPEDAPMSPEESEPLALILNLKWTVPPCGEQTAQCHAGNATTMATDAEAGKRDVSQGGDLEEAFSVLHQDFAVCREEALGLAIQPPDLLSMPHLVLEVELQ